MLGIARMSPNRAGPVPGAALPAPWKNHPDFQSGALGRVGALRGGEWDEEGAALWQWRGLWSKPHSGKIAARWKKIPDLPAPDHDWFESPESMRQALSNLRRTPQVLDIALHHPQVARWVRTFAPRPYEDRIHPLCWAVSARSLVALRHLLGLDVRWACLAPDTAAFKADRERSPLMHAIRAGWYAGAVELHRAGATIHDSPLGPAVLACCPELVRFFLAEGCDPYHRNAEGQTLLGRMARSVPDRLFSQVGGGGTSLSEDQQAQWVATALPLVEAGASLDVHDGKTARAFTVRQLWDKHVGPSAGAALGAAVEAGRLRAALDTAVPSAPQVPRPRL